MLAEVRTGLVRKAIHGGSLEPERRPPERAAQSQVQYPAAEMTSVDLTEQAAADGDSNSELDALDEFSEKLNAFEAFRSSDTEAADKLFESLGGRGKVEQDMLLQLGAWKPLYKPDRLEHSHQVAMRALEVLYRNGHRKAPAKLGPVTPMAQYFVQLVTRFVCAITSRTSSSR